MKKNNVIETKIRNFLFLALACMPYARGPVIKNLHKLRYIREKCPLEVRFSQVHLNIEWGENELWK